MPAVSAPSLTVENLGLIRGERELIAGLSFSAGPGEAVLLRGPNGAGKTSLLMCLATYLPNSIGTISWTGLPDDTHAVELMHSVGHLPGIKPALTLNENLRFWTDLYGSSADGIEPVLEESGLGGLGDLPASTLSAGQTKRLALSRLLVAPRPVWLLDEPTSNLDTDGDKWIAGLVDAHLSANGLAIIATHRDLPLGKKARMTTLSLEKMPA